VTTAIEVRAFDPATDRSWASDLLDRELAGSVQARKGEALDALDLPGLVAEGDGREMGLLFYRLDGEDCELFLLLATEPSAGIGTALVEALVARATGRRRIWVVTTNDNLRALRFYQRRGFALCALRPGAVDDTRRRLKPGIPVTGDDGIPRRDELELERLLP
jgi:ribosomal protein S18 acetylase RimI-like enzyme